MTTKPERPSADTQAVRRHTDVNLSARVADNLSPLAVQQLLHDLQVHQVELQLQNEELRQAQIALEESHARYFDLYDLAPVGYLTVAANGLILEANLCAATMLGVPRTKLIKRSLSRLVAKVHQDLYYHCRRQLLETGEAQTCEIKVLQSDGAELWVKMHISALAEAEAEAEAEAVKLRVVLSDISERKHLDVALQLTNQSLESARLQADKANLAKSEFLSSMSHELRSPLNAILGFAQLMEAGTPPPTPSQKASLAQIIKGGWYLLTLINDILDLASIESGHSALAMEPVVVSAILGDCQTLIEPLAADQSVQLHFPESTATCCVHADPTRFKQVLINLLSNAIKYNQVGGSVHVRCHATSQGRCRISVHDTGVGLPAHKLAQLFQPFNRIGQEAGNTKGTGIGLVVSQQLVKAMGGEMGVSSTVGGGSVFWFDLDFADAPASISPPDLAPAAELAAPAPVSAVARTVLYIEDNPANMALIEQILARRKGLQLLGAPDALRGVAMARNIQPDVIVMDINLPGISGTEALKILQADPLTAHIPVLALSANAMPHDIEAGLAAGFYAYLTKPIRVNAFLEALDQGLELAAKSA